MSYEFKPDWTMCPGEILEEWFEDNGLPKSIAWQHHGIPMETLAGILAGEQKLDLGLIGKLAKMTQVPESMWLNLELMYRDGLTQGLTHLHNE